MGDEPPSPTDPSPSTSPQTALDSGEEDQQSIPQCEEVDARRSIFREAELAAEEVIQLNEKSSIRVAYCPLPDDGGERRSASADGQESLLAGEREEKLQIEEEKVSALQERGEGDTDKLSVIEPAVEGIVGAHPTEELNGERDQLAEGYERVSSLKEEEEQKVPVSKASVSIATAEVMEENIEVKTSDVDEAYHSENFNEEPHAAKMKDEGYLFGEHQEDNKAPIFEPIVVNEVMEENVNKKLLDVDDALQPPEDLREVALQLPDQDEKDCLLEEALVARDEKVSTSEVGLEGKEGEWKVLVSDEIMEEDIKEKLLGFNETEPAEHLDEEMSHEKDSSLEGRIPMSEMSGPITGEENAEGKLSEEQLGEEKPQIIKKRKKVSLSP